MKVYVAKYFESEKGLSVEGFRYRKVVENGRDNYIGLYCSYFLKSGLYDYATAKSLIDSRTPLEIVFSEDSNAYKMKEKETA